MTRLPRPLAALALALAVATCRDALAPFSGKAAGRIAVAPVFPSAATLAEFGLSIDAVRFVVVRPPADTVADTTVALAPDVDELALDLSVPLLTDPESLSVSVIALSGTIPLFTGTQLVQVPTPLPPPEILLDSYVGPAADSIVIAPRSPFLLLNDSLRFQVQGFNAGAPVTQFYVAWSTSDSTVAEINHFGVLRAPAIRSSVRVIARTPSGAADSVTASFMPAATQLVPVAGGGQADTVGTSLDLPLEVRALAGDGLGVGGVSVRFRAVTGGGSVTDTLVVTDSTGGARTTATLGGLLGLQTFEASVTGLAGSPVTFSATALAGPPTRLLATAGDAQLATVATPVPTRPAVVLKDAGGNPVAGATVTFTVASGGGGVTGGTQTTDATGAATVGAWTLGTLAGSNTLTTSAAGLTHTFTATGVADSAAQLVVTAGDLQSAAVGTAVAIDPAVRAQDQFGNPVAGASIAFTVSAGGGSVSGGTQLTSAAGTATVGGWTLGPAVGTNALQASLTGVTPVTFTATGTAGAATAIVKVAGDSQTGVVSAAVGTAPQVKLVDQFGNPVAGVSVTFAVAAGGGAVGGASQVTDPGGVATVGGWTLGTGAGPNALTASAGALSETFTAEAVAGPAMQMAPFAGNGQTAAVNSVLPVAPAVIVRDQFNNPISGAAVAFVASGNGSVAGGSQITDSTGVATVGSWRIDSIAGPNSLGATSGSLTASFTATGLAGAAAQLVKTAGDGITAVVGSLVGPAPAVQVRDVFGNPVPGQVVTFGVTGGAGTVTGATDTAGAGGLASVGSWTLDTIAGGNALTATAGPLSAVFTATGTAGAPTLLAKVLGDGQVAVVNTPLPDPPTVRLTDRYGNPVAGDTIDFAILVDGGAVGSPTAVTDAAGTASAGTWTIADFAALNRLRAVARGIPAVPAVDFTAQGTPDVAFQILRETVDTQTAIAGNAVSAPPAIRVRDQFFNPVPGVSVSFTLTGALQGSVSPASAISDASGLAQVTTWTIAPTVGLNTLEAAVPGLLNSPIVFSATGVTTTAFSIEPNPAGSGDGQTAVVGTTLPVSYSVRVLDAAGVPVQNVQVAWTAAAGSGAMSPPTSLTDLSGVATSTHSLGAAAGPQTASASVGGLSGSPVLFTATALADTAAILVKLSPDPQSAPAGSPVSAPVVKVTDLFDNPLAGVVVSFTLTGGGTLGAAVDTTDAAGLATAGSWTLDTQTGSDTVTVGSGSLFPVTFTADARAGAAAAVVMVDGDGQTGTAGEPLPLPYRVRVTDALGNGVTDVTVNWSIGARASGGIDPASGPTDTAGIATAIHTLGNTVGPHSAFAWVSGLPDTVTFTSTAAAGTAAFIVKLDGDTQTATVNTPVTIQPTVMVTDASGAPVSGYPVAWAVTAGGGSLGTPDTVRTDALGVAMSPVWTLGTAAGGNGLSATAAGLSGSPVAFTATATAGAPAQLLIKSGNNQTDTVFQTLPLRPTVELRDQFNNLVPGVQVTFTVTSGGGSATGTGPLTDSKGIAAVGSWRLGTTAGLNTLRASVTGIPAVTFSATGVAGVPAQLKFVTEPVTTLAGDTIDPPVRVGVQDEHGNTVFTATGVVQLGLGALGNPAAKLVGTTDLSVVSGVATFSDLAVDSAGLGYTLVAAFGNLGAESQPFDVTGVIASVPGDRLDPVDAAFNPATGLVYVPGLSNTLAVFDPSKVQLSQFPMLPAPPFAVAVNPQTSLAYVTTLEGVAVVDVRDPTPVPVTAIFVGTDPKGIALDEQTNRVFVAVTGDAQRGEPSLVTIDALENVIKISVPLPPEVGGAGVGVAFNPDDRLVYVAIPAFGLAVYDPATEKFIATIPIVGDKGASGTYGVAVDPRTKLVFATNRVEGTLSMVDPAGFAERGRIAVGALPEFLGVDSERGVVYVVNSGANTVSFIDTGKFTVLGTLVVGPTPKAAAVDPASGRVYVPTFSDSRVVVVQP